MKINSLIKVAYSLVKSKQFIELARKRKDLYRHQLNRVDKVDTAFRTKGGNSLGARQRIDQLRDNAISGAARNWQHETNLQNLVANRKMRDSGVKNMKPYGILGNKGNYIP